MDKTTLFVRRKILPSVGAGLFIFASIAVTGLAAFKLSQATRQTPVRTNDVLASNDNAQSESQEKTYDNAGVKGAAPRGDDNRANEENEEAAPSAQTNPVLTINGFVPVSQPITNDNLVTNNNPTSNQITANPAQNQASNRCIITIFSQQYDLTSFISSHPGGNVFKCGTDQTALYSSAHGSNVSRLSPFLATANAGSISQTGNNAVLPVSSFAFEEDDSNDDRHENQDEDRNRSDSFEREREDD